MRSNNPLFFCLISAFLLQGCSSLPLPWSGSDDDEVVITGERIEVLKGDTELPPSPLLADKTVTIKDPVENTLWPQSNVGHYIVQGNLSLPDSVRKFDTIDVGYSAEKGIHLTATPVIVDNMLYTMDGRGHISAFNARNPDDPIWRTKLGSKHHPAIGGGMTYYDEKLFITTGHNVLYALDMKDGSVLWQYTLTTIARSAPVASASIVTVLTASNDVVAFNVDTGQVRWSYTGLEERTSLFGSASPLIVGRTLLVPQSSGEIAALDLLSGRELWNDSLAQYQRNQHGVTFSDIDATPVLKNNIVYAISRNGLFATYDIKKGARLWEHSISGSQPPWVEGEYVFLIDKLQRLIAIHIPSGKIKWVSQLQQYEDMDDQEDPIMWNGPVLAGGHLWIASSDGRLVRLSVQDGTVTRTIDVPSDIYLPPIVAHNQLYLFSDDAKLVVLR